MKTKIMLIWLIIAAMLASAAYTQTDTTKSVYIKNVKVTPGKYYEFHAFDSQTFTGKLVSVNSSGTVVLIYTDNSLIEYDVSQLTYMKEIDSQYIINTGRPSHARKEKACLSVSIGYTSHKRNDVYDPNNYNQSGTSCKGLNITGDIMLKISDYFGLSTEVGLTHEFGKKYSSDDYYGDYNAETEYDDRNIVTIKWGVATGYVKDNEIFNCYISLGIGLSYTFSFTEKNSYYFYGDYYSYTVDRGSNVEFGIYGGLRFKYSISPKHSVFIEPSFQKWFGDNNGVINLKGGISFNI